MSARPCIPNHAAPRARAVAVAVAALHLLLPGGAVRAQSAAPSPPFVHGLQLNADAGTDTGSRLEFTLQGPPRGTASIRIGAGRAVVSLRETTPGVYRGLYTVRRSDRIDPADLLHATITAGADTSAHTFAFPPAILAAHAGPWAFQPHSVADIQRFATMTDGSLEAGSQVRFVVHGSPGGMASVSVPGVVRAVALREARPGVYRGSHTVRPGDNVAGFAAATATLQAGSESVSSQLTEPLQARDYAPESDTRILGAARQELPLRVVSPAHRASVGGGRVIVQGRTAPHAVVSVRVEAVPPPLDQRVSVAQPLVARTVRADASGAFSFSLGERRVSPPGTRYEVSMTARQGAQAAESRLVLYQRPG